MKELILEGWLDDAPTPSEVEAMCSGETGDESKEEGDVRKLMERTTTRR